MMPRHFALRMPTDTTVPALLPFYTTTTATTASISQAPRVWERLGPRWEVCLTLSDGSFSQVSFVNAIATTHGGQHVAVVADQIAEAVVVAATKKAGGAKAG